MPPGAYVDQYYFRRMRLLSATQIEQVNAPTCPTWSRVLQHQASALFLFSLFWVLLVVSKCMDSGRNKSLESNTSVESTPADVTSASAARWTFLMLSSSVCNSSSVWVNHPLDPPPQCWHTTVKTLYDEPCEVAEDPLVGFHQPVHLDPEHCQQIYIEV